MSTRRVRFDRTGPLQPEDYVTHSSGQVFQVCRVGVETADGEERVALFAAADARSFVTQLHSLSESLTNEFGAATAALVTEPSEGKVSVEVSGKHETRALVVAAAAAVMRANWSWDESATIVVAVNGTDISVTPRFVEGEWTAAPADRAPNDIDPSASLK